MPNNPPVPTPAQRFQDEKRRVLLEARQQRRYSRFCSRCPSGSYNAQKFDILFKGERCNALQHIAKQLKLSKRAYVLAAYNRGDSPRSVPRDLPLPHVAACVARAYSEAQQVYFATNSSLPRWTTSRSRFLRKAFKCIRQQHRFFKARLVSAKSDFLVPRWRGDYVPALYVRLRNLRAVLRTLKRQYKCERRQQQQQQ